MKNKILNIVAIMFFMSTVCVAQIPVTDAAAGAQLSSLNLQITILKQQVANTNTKLSNLSNKVQSTNNKLDRSNDYLEKIANLKKEEIDAYKNAPDNRLVSYQKQTLMDEKRKIVYQMKRVLSWMDDLEHITEREKDKMERRLTDLVLRITVIWTQTNDLLAASDKIIPAGERQTMLEETLKVFQECLSKIEQDEAYLKMINTERKSRVELIGF